MAQVCTIDGRPVPVDLASVFSLEELRYRVAEVMGAPSPDNVELLDEEGERLEHVDFISNLGDMKIQTFLFGLPDPGDEDDDNEPKYTAIEELEDESTTRASSEQADSPSRSFPLHELVNLGDSDAVTQLLADGVDIHKRDADGETALHRAAYHGRADLVHALLGARADPNAADRKGKTPLRRGYDSKEVTEALLSAGADPNTSDKYGSSVLHRAAEDDHLDVAKVLLSVSADPNLISEDDLTPLHTAAIFGRPEMVKLLLSSGADIESKGVAGNRALHFAAYGRHEAAGKVLLGGGADRTARNEDGETPLEHANSADGDVPAWLINSGSS